MCLFGIPDLRSRLFLDCLEYLLHFRSQELSPCGEIILYDFNHADKKKLFLLECLWNLVTGRKSDAWLVGESTRL
jgi:hypothetical protein